MKFTTEERKKIDRLLEEAKEYQKQNGNKTYTIEEVEKEVYEQYKRHLEEWNKSKINNVNVKKKEDILYKYL